jgi:hypothetical protein
MFIDFKIQDAVAHIEGWSEAVIEYIRELEQTAGGADKAYGLARPLSTATGSDRLYSVQTFGNIQGR